MRQQTFLRLGNRRRAPRGAALLEMVVVFIVLFYLAMGTVEFGWYLYAKHTLTAAARDGARTGIIGTNSHAQTVAQINATMQAAGFGNIAYTTKFEDVGGTYNGQLTYTTVTDVTTIQRADGLRVTVSAPFSAFGVRPLGVIPATKQISCSTTMVKE